MDEMEFAEIVNGRERDVVPDPQRYEVKEQNGKKSYFDRKENRLITPEVVEQQLAAVKNPVVVRYYEPKIRSGDELDKYIEMRKRKIEEFFRSENREFVMKGDDRSEQFLNSIYLMSKDKKIKCSFVTLDLRGFTKMGQSMKGTDLTTLATVLSREAGMLADQYSGFVLKYMGDGLVAYFTGPNVIFMVNNSIAYANALKRVVLEAINPVFEQNRFPKLKFGIAIESGVVHVSRVGSWYTKLHHDLIGPPINITFKIQTLSKENDVLMGEHAAKYAKGFTLEPVKLPAEWSYVHQQEDEKTPEQIEEGFRRKSSIVERIRSAMGLRHTVKEDEKFKVYRLC